jgi:hypothetical protein
MTFGIDLVSILLYSSDYKQEDALMKKVPLGGLVGKGKFALVDDEDVQLVAKHTWYLCSTGYATTTVHISGSKKTGIVQKGISMHRLIMGFPKEQVDHVNRDKLDNQRSNLRLASHTQNCWNADKQPSNTGYRGVRRESENVFSARVGQKVIGYYRTAELAAQARDIEALKVRGEFAVLNFDPNELPESVECLPPRNVGERTSKVVGVSYMKGRKGIAKWRVTKNRKHHGWFETEELAIAKRLELDHEG